MPATSLDQIASLAKRRGFIFPGSEIYGGLANTWDYGPYGVELKNNLKQLWWKFWITNRDDIVGLDAAILMNPRAWEASGHVANFSDPLVDCKACNKRHRGDKLLEEKYGMEIFSYAESLIKEIEKEGVNHPLVVLNAKGSNTKDKEWWVGETIKDLKSKKSDSIALVNYLLKTSQITCPDCGKCNWAEAKKFNLMFKTQQGVIEGESKDIYLRPETAQGIFVNFKNVQSTTRKRLPFGIAQIGKAFRNEITPGNLTFRTREFEQMEIEYFCAEKDWKEVYAKLEAASWEFFLTLGITEGNLRWRQHEDTELSHYSSLTKDVEYKFPWGWGELQGLAYRSNYDLTQHEKFSGEKMDYTDPDTNEKFTPHCVEPSFGCDRSVLTVLLDAYTEEKVGEDDTRIVMKFAPKLAPIKVAILPLSKKENLTKEAIKIYEMLRKDFRCEYDETQSIGKRYRRQDEIGTPLCITVDFGTIGEEESGQSKKGFVTVRDRDTLQQEAVKIEDLPEFVRKKIEG
ncbi:MAG: glycine--tRNA ligase [Candidatus Gracilibacteria bacterium]|jgi:glycyl-tRNA synthetase